MKGILKQRSVQLCALLLLALLYDRPASGADSDEVSPPSPSSADITMAEDIQLKQVLRLLNADANQVAKNTVDTINLKFARNGNPLWVHVVDLKTGGSQQLESEIKQVCTGSRQSTPQTKKMKLVFLPATATANKPVAKQTSESSK